ncbi:MAG: transporter substrate-binding domain-containing protein [Holosporales bacterium]|nr:transporter substrate-binding domain-containing protein [Holosporales bacterium]
MSSDLEKGDAEAVVDFVDPDKFSYDNVNYETVKPPPEVDQGKRFGDVGDIVRRGELVVLARNIENTPIFLMKTKNGFVGEDVEFAKLLADGLGVRLTMRMIYSNCDEIVDAIANGEGDIGISKISYTDERGAKVLYTNPYVTSGLCMLVNRLAIKQLRVSTLHDLFANKKAVIAGHKDTSYEYYAREFATHAKFVSDADWEGVIVKNLRNNKFSATVRDSIVINLLLHKKPRYCLELLPIMLKDNADSYAAVVNMKKSSLCLWINKLLAIKRGEQPDISRLIKKYSGYIK